MKRAHTMPFGAQRVDGSHTRFRLWAPSAKSVELLLTENGGTPSHAMTAGADGWYELVTRAPAGTRYRYRINGELDVPDPASRFNPEDVHAASEVIDPHGYDWPDESWRGKR